MLTTTGYNFEGYEICEYIDVISEEIVLGTGFLSSFDTGVADFSGGRSHMYEKKLEHGKMTAIQKLKKRALCIGGNAIIGIDIDYTTFDNDVMGIIVSGTAVRVQKIKKQVESLQYTFQSLVYNPNLPFNICSLDLVHNIFSKATVGSVLIKNYIDGYNVTAIIVDIEFEELFGDKHNVSDVIFTCHSVEENNEYSTDFTEIPMRDIHINLVRKIYVFPKKFIVNDNGKIILVDSNGNVKREQLTDEDLIKLRKKYGQDAICDFEADDKMWKCYCGAKNPIEKNICKRCNREVNRFKKKVASTSENNIDDLEKLIEEAEKLSSAKQIYNLIKDRNNSSYDILLKEIEPLLKEERLWGDMSDSAISKIKKLME